MKNPFYAFVFFAVSPVYAAFSAQLMHWLLVRESMASFVAWTISIVVTVVSLSCAAAVLFEDS